MIAIDEKFMRLALDQARRARRAGEVPVGAVVVMGGEVIGTGHNAVLARVDPTAHAELLALRDAAKRVGNYRLMSSTLYCTVEPCLMCLGGATHARVDRLVFGAADPKLAGATRIEALSGLGTSLNHRFETEGGVLAAEAAELLLDFFRERRSAEGTGGARTASGEVPKWS